MPDPDPASPKVIKERRSRIECGMTTFLGSLLLLDVLSGLYSFININTDSQLHTIGGVGMNNK